MRCSGRYRTSAVGLIPAWLEIKVYVAGIDPIKASISILLFGLGRIPQGRSPRLQRPLKIWWPFSLLRLKMLRVL
jgi:hypothetical protein